MCTISLLSHGFNGQVSCHFKMHFFYFSLTQKLANGEQDFCLSTITKRDGYPGPLGKSKQKTPPKCLEETEEKSKLVETRLRNVLNWTRPVLPTSIHNR